LNEEEAAIIIQSAYRSFKVSSLIINWLLQFS
jgi:hypothetical protein